jgi:hypothetical protein
MNRATRIVGILIVPAVFLLFAPSAYAQTEPAAGQAASPQALREELDKLRREFEAVRDAYGARLAALEAKLGAAETTQPTAPTPAVPLPPLPPPPTAPATAPAETAGPPGALGAGGPTGALPVYGGAAASSKIFNPDIAVIGNFLGAVGENEINPPPGFELNEVEATFQAVVDPYARADLFLSFSPDG